MDSGDDDLYDSDTAMDYDGDFMDDGDGSPDDTEDDLGGNSHQNYVVLKEKDVIKRQEDLIRRISSILSVSREEAILMLHHYKWNEDYVNEAWFADEDTVRKAVGLKSSSPNDRVAHFRKEVRDSPQGNCNTSCGICFDDYSLDKMDSLACGHFFCTACWGSFISTSINDGPGCLTLKCPIPKCGISVGQDMIEKFADQKSLKKYHQYVVNSYVQGSKNIKWCPSPGCEVAIEYVSGSGSFDVTCDCSYSFCWNCTNELHRPVDCETVAKWDLKNSNESENANWILAFTKPCPKCNTPIEKNNGCMHMTCRPPCRHEFCWTCLGDYKGHGVCNRFSATTQDGPVNDAEMKRQIAKSMVERYMHYYERWIANHRSREKARTDLEKMRSMHLEALSLKHCQTDEQLKFIPEAWLQIIECRRVLKWTYAYGYYFPENEGNKKRFFEYLQGEAEAGLERLHRCAEKELDHFLSGGEGPFEDFNEYRAKLIGLTRTTRTYFENLVSALENGLADVDSQVASKKNGDKTEDIAERTKKIEGKRKRDYPNRERRSKYVHSTSSDDGDDGH